MIHLKYKCKVNFVKLPLIWIDLCLKLVFENATTSRNTGCRSVANCASQVAKIMLTTQKISRQVEYITGQLVPWDAVHTKACTGIKSAHNSVTVQNRTHVYMNFFWSKRPRKSLPAVMSSSRETPCILRKDGQDCIWGLTIIFHFVSAVHSC